MTNEVIGDFASFFTGIGNTSVTYGPAMSNINEYSDCPVGFYKNQQLACQAEYRFLYLPKAGVEIPVETFKLYAKGIRGCFEPVTTPN